MQAFCGDMPVAIAKQQACQFHPLTGGAQARMAQSPNGLNRQGLAVA
jgi:hypothetical protein